MIGNICRFIIPISICERLSNFKRILPSFVQILPSKSKQKLKLSLVCALITYTYFAQTCA